MRYIKTLIALIFVLISHSLLASNSNLAPGEDIKARFDAWLSLPDAYEKRALEDSQYFPEGRIYPFILPALGYIQLGMRGQLDRQTASHKARLLIDMAIPQVADHTNAPNSDLLLLKDYRLQGTFISTLNYALSLYGFIDEDSPYAELNSHLSDLLIAGLKWDESRTIQSYPTYTWYFDTMMTYMSLHAGNHQIDIVKSLFKEHLVWRENHILLESGLPIAFDGETSRGCDISWQILMLANMYPRLAREMYDQFVTHHWIDLGLLVGFAEWPDGYDAPVGGDIDSGPIVAGIGSTASGVGIMATKAMGDIQRHERMLMALKQAHLIIHTAIDMGVSHEYSKWMDGIGEMSKDYYTGFLYGDAALFFILTWDKYDRPPFVE